MPVIDVHTHAIPEPFLDAVKSEGLFGIRFEKGELTFHGRRPAGHEFGATAYHRTFAVDDTVSPDKISAELKGGVLTIHLPKIEAVKPKRITVTG